VSQISRDEVAHLARLARLALTDSELDGFVGQLDAILAHVSQIQAVDVTGVEATDNPIKDVNVFRPDVVRPHLERPDVVGSHVERPDLGLTVPPGSTSPVPAAQAGTGVTRPGRPTRALRPPTAGGR